MIIRRVSPRNNVSTYVCGSMVYLYIPPKILMNNDINMDMFMDMFIDNFTMYLSTSLYRYYDLEINKCMHRYNDGKLIRKNNHICTNFVYGICITINTSDYIDEITEYLGDLYKCNKQYKNINILHTIIFIEYLLNKDKIYFIFQKQDRYNYYKMYVGY